YSTVPHPFRGLFREMGGRPTHYLGAGSIVPITGRVNVCPVCIATAVLIAGSATSTGGIGAFVVTKILRKKPTSTENQEVNHGNHSSGN
ncbi:MAG: hypothetical protein WBE74_01985, partial [Terracidiphilus sp.]